MDKNVLFIYFVSQIIATVLVFNDIKGDADSFIAAGLIILAIALKGSDNV